MKKKLKRSDELNSDENLFELAHIGHEDTGLPMLTWISLKMSSHGPRVKFSRTHNHRAIVGDTFSISITDEPKIVAGDQGDISNDEVNLACEWIVLNKKLLLDYWDGKINTGDMIRNLKNI